MTRINTNVSSLNAQKTLARSNAQLQEALTRLSTGLRINSGKDDPAGLIASEMLRSDIISTQTAVTNSERANQMIATADSALGQVSSLLNDIRGLVSEAANEGAMSQEQIDANQLQVDSSLEAIDRISQVTQFQGKRLLDGSLDFITEGITASELTGVQIDQANFGTQNQIDVSVNVVTQATKGSLTFNGTGITSDVVLEVGGSKGFEAFSFGSGSTVADMATAINLVSDALGITAEVNSVIATSDHTGSMNLSNVGGTTAVHLEANAAGLTEGATAVKYVLGTNVGTVVTGHVATADDPRWFEVALQASNWVAANTTDAGNAITLGAGTMDLRALIAGAQYNGLRINLTDAAGDVATYDAQNKIINVTTTLGAGTDIADIAVIINDDLGHLFLAAQRGAGIATAGLSAATFNNATIQGTTGGVIAATSANVVTQLDLEAELVATGGGADVIQHLLSDYAYLGTLNTGTATDLNNHIQLIGPSMDALPVQMVNNGASKTLQIDFVENRQTGGYAQVTVQGTAADASFKVTAKNQGTAYDGVAIVFVDTSVSGLDDNIAWDPQNKQIRIYDDFTAPPTAATIVGRINGDQTVSALFEAEIFGASGANAVATTAAGGSSTVGTLADGHLYDAITIQLATNSAGTITTTAAELIDYINNTSPGMTAMGITASNADNSTGAGLMSVQSTAFATVGITRRANEFPEVTTFAENGTNARLNVKALTAGAAYDGVKVMFRQRGTDPVSVSYDSAAKELNIYVDDATDDVNDVLAAFSATNNPTEYYLFQLTVVGTGAGVIRLTDTGTLTGGTTTSGTSKGAALVGNWDQGDLLGTSGLRFLSQNYGSENFVSVKAIEGTFATVNVAGAASNRENGTDVLARINGIQAIGKGLQATINTSALDLSVWVDEDVIANTTSTFTITGGGAQFQLGPDVVSNQQARIGIASVSTATLGGNSGEGRLFEIRSGNDNSLTNNTSGAANIVESVITQITSLRGRLGAFQKTTLQTNIDALSDTIEALTGAESSIRDADFAAESAALTRAQILVQSGISVLSIANQNPQNVLALLR